MKKIEQYVMAYRGEFDELKKLAPEGFSLLRPVLRINAEIINGDKEERHIEYNLPVEGRGKRGWLNIACWRSNITVEKKDKETTFIIKDGEREILRLHHKRAGVGGGCPHEADNEGMFFEKDGGYVFKPSRIITESKEYCDCDFKWSADIKGEERLKAAVKIACLEILGAYTVTFDTEE